MEGQKRLSAIFNLLKGNMETSFECKFFLETLILKEIIWST